MNVGRPPIMSSSGSDWRPPPGWRPSEDNMRQPMTMHQSEEGMRPMMVPPSGYGPIPTRPSLDPRVSEISEATRPTTRGPLQSSIAPLQRAPVEQRPSNEPNRPPMSEFRKPEERTDTSSRPSTASSKPESGLLFGQGHASPREPIARPPIVNRPSSYAQSVPTLTEIEKTSSLSGLPLSMQIPPNGQAPPRPYQQQQQYSGPMGPQGRPPPPRDVAQLQQNGGGDASQRLNFSQGQPSGLGLTTGAPRDQEDESPVTTERIQGFPTPPMRDDRDRDREPPPQQYFSGAPRQQSPAGYVDEYEPPFPNRRQTRYDDAYDGYDGYDEPQQGYAAYANHSRGRGYPQGIPPLRPLAPTADVNNLLGRQEAPVHHGGPPPLGSARGRAWIRGRFSRQPK